MLLLAFNFSACTCTGAGDTAVSTVKAQKASISKTCNRMCLACARKRSEAESKHAIRILHRGPILTVIFSARAARVVATSIPDELLLMIPLQLLASKTCNWCSILRCKKLTQLKRLKLRAYFTALL